MDAAAAIARLHAGLTPKEREWLAEVPVERALEAIDAMPEGFDFNDTTPELEAVDATVSVKCAPEWAGPYWNLVLMHLVAKRLERGWPFVVPTDVRRSLLGELGRITNECETGPARPDPLGDGEFLTDLGFARGILIPFGMGVGVAPVWLTDDPDDDRPWIMLHLRGRRAREVSNDDAHIEGSILIGQFLRANPEYRGLFGTGWLSDPKVGDVSPHLAILRKMAADSGGTLVAVDTDADTIAHATSTSATRRRHYEEGSWTPTDYRIEWTRENYLRWVETLGSSE